MARKKDWAGLFEKQGLTGRDFLTEFLDSLARIFQEGTEDEALEKIQRELKRVFNCENISIFLQDPDDEPEADEGEWVLSVRSGVGIGNRVSQADGESLPSLAPGRPVPFNQSLAQDGALKAISLAFEEDAFYGCDIERNKIVLIKDPTPEDDLGSGDLSVLAIPLRYINRYGRVFEKKKIGVLALYNTPTRRDFGDIERSLRLLIAQAMISPRATLRDPVTGLYTEAHLRSDLERQFRLFDYTRGKLNGGFVVGLVDTLKLYKMSLVQSNIPRAEVAETISGAIQGVAECIQKRVDDYQLGPEQDYGGGLAGRIGREGFGIILPLMKPHELRVWSLRVAKEIVDYHFPGEEALTTGDLTVSLRIIPFGHPGAHSASAVWDMGRKQIAAIQNAQEENRSDSRALKETVNTVDILTENGDWDDVG